MKVLAKDVNNRTVEVEVSAANIKGGVVSGGSFSGSPKIYDVVFVTDMDDDSYVISLTSTDGRSLTYSNKTASGFRIETNANTAVSGEVSWLAIPGANS